MSWIVLALTSAALWGVSYVLYEQLLKAISPASAMLYSALGSSILFAFVALIGGSFTNDLQILKKTGVEFKYIMIIIVINSIANLLAFYSIKLKNATAMGMIEISYPLFTALFAYLLFKENQLTSGLLIGGFLIVSGVVCIIYFDKPI